MSARIAHLKAIVSGRIHVGCPIRSLNAIVFGVGFGWSVTLMVLPSILICAPW